MLTVGGLAEVMHLARAFRRVNGISMLHFGQALQSLVASPLCTTIKYGHSAGTGTTGNEIFVFRFPGHLIHPERSGEEKENR